MEIGVATWKRPCYERVFLCFNGNQKGVFAMFKRSPLNDGTQGYRYSWGLTRKRSIKRRYGISTGPVMTAIHAGKRSVYIERKNPVRYLHNFAG